VPRRMIFDRFHNRATRAQALAAIHRHWDVIWPILARKIAEGQVEIVHHDHGAQLGKGWRQEIRQVTLYGRDLPGKDFRRS
ncbi:MAG: hypothetical protein ACREEP_12280, partial [Dongiaceae bacterium]